MCSPAADTVGTDGVLVTVTCGPASAATVAESFPSTGRPDGSSAATVAVLWIAPASMSACVAEYVHENSHVSPTSSAPLPLVSPAPNTGAHNGSVTATDDSVTFPSLVTATV